MFFEGTRWLELDDWYGYNEYYGMFRKQSDSEYFYAFGVAETGTVYWFTFKNINGQWLLTEFTAPWVEDDYSYQHK